MPDRPPLSVALFQHNPTVGAVGAIRERLLQAVRDARGRVDLVIFPELATVGYPPKDLLASEGFVDANLETVEALREASRGGPAIIVGHVGRRRGHGKALANSATLLADGRALRRWDKTLLPSYDVFDEDRYFEPARETGAVELRGWRVGVTICEDIWTDPSVAAVRYARAPVEALVEQGVDLIVNISASPYEVDKLARRREIVRQLAASGGVPILYCNQIGANDELVFDGGSFAVDGQGRLIAQAPQFEVATLEVALPAAEQPAIEPPEEGLEAALAALELGLSDYLAKTGFESVVLGLSGGIDSALTCAIAARALGPDKVRGLLMPSPHSSDHSVADALALAQNLGVQTHTLPIGPLMMGFSETLGAVEGFASPEAGLALENIQARIRGTLLMAYSNRFGHLLLSTGNKSEVAVGYCTLYGDMAGGLALISDVPKLMVYELSRLINALEGREIIPESTLTKPPSAELRPDQLDTDSLPPYEVLDAIITAYVEGHQDEPEIVALGHEPALVRRVIELIHRTEYKRRQAAPGIKITSKAFGFGRRFPIAHRRR